MGTVRKLAVEFSLLLVTLAAVGSWASATASASGTCTPGGNPPYCEPIPTKLVATPVLFDGLAARLTRVDTGAPLPGQTLIFSAGGTVLCVQATDINGSASCDSPTSLALAILNLGYTVTYPGTTVYAPAKAHGPLLELLGIVLHTRLPSHLSAHERAVLRARLQRIGEQRLLREIRHLRGEHKLA